MKTASEKYFRYVRRATDRVIELLLLIASAALIFTFILYSAKYLWILFTATEVGQIYAKMYPEKCRLTESLLSGDFIGLAFELTLISSLICLVVGAVLKFLHITRFIFSGRGFFSRFFLVGLPMTFAVAAFIHLAGYYSRMETAFMMVFVPVSCVFAGFFRLTNEFVPELTDLTTFLKGGEKTAEEKHATVKIQTVAYEPVQKNGATQENTFGKTLLRDIWELGESFITVVVIIMAGAGIMLAIPKIQNLSKSPEMPQVQVSADAASRQEQEKPPVEERFAVYPEKIVLDKKTRLMWSAEESPTLTWNEAAKYCRKFRAGGYKDWRMPTIGELATLYDESRQPDCGCVTGLIEMVNGPNCWEWSSETKGMDAAMFAFNLNGKQWMEKANDSSVHIRPVRTVK